MDENRLELLFRRNMLPRDVIVLEKYKMNMDIICSLYSSEKYPEGFYYIKGDLEVSMRFMDHKFKEQIEYWKGTIDKIYTFLENMDDKIKDKICSSKNVNTITIGFFDRQKEYASWEGSLIEKHNKEYYIKFDVDVSSIIFYKPGAGAFEEKGIYTNSDFDWDTTMFMIGPKFELSKFEKALNDITYLVGVITEIHREENKVRTAILDRDKPWEKV